MSNAKKVAFLGIFTALAIIVGYLERLIPAPVAIPGIKLGFSNVIILIALYYFGAKEALGISIVRIFVTGLLFSGLSGILYSLSGGILSFIVMVIWKKTRLFSVIGISVLGGVFHNTGQILIAAAVVENIKLLYYLPVLIISGIITGIITGLAAGFTLNHLTRIKTGEVRL